MKKFIIILLSCMVVIVSAGCGTKNIKTPDLPDKDKVTSIEISNSDNKNGVIINRGIVSNKIITNIKKAIKESDGKGDESTDDVPKNVDKFFIVSIFSDKEKPDVFCFYEKKGNKYMESPYNGIWEISDETYNKIMKLIG